jgi:hypothetical protein
MSIRFEHCRLVGNKIEYLGRVGIFEDKNDAIRSAAHAWDFLENDGWELVSVIIDSDGHVAHYFKRPAVPENQK